MTYSVWVFEDAAHCPAFTPSPQPYRHQSAVAAAQQPPAAAAVAAAAASVALPPPPLTPQRLHRPPRRTLHAQPPRFACLQLDVNRTTGRLQWCPRFKYVKAMLLLPIALTPVVLVLVLLGQLETVGSVRQHRHQLAGVAEAAAPVGAPPSPNAVDAEPTFVGADGADDFDGDNDDGDDDDDDDDAMSYARVDRPRCRAVRYSLSETLDSEERELWRDVRTAFVPPEYVDATPDCVVPLADPVADDNDDDDDDEDNDDSNDNDTINTNDVIDAIDAASDRSAYGRSDYRQRRAAAGNVTDMWEKLRSAAERAIDLSAPIRAAGPVEGTGEEIRAAQAEVMLQYMDPKVDPCSNFYEYACGHWERLNSIPKDKGAFDTFEMLREKLDVILKQLLSEPVGTEGDATVTTRAPDEQLPATLSSIDAVAADTAAAAASERDAKGDATGEQKRLRRRIYRRRAELRKLLQANESDNGGTDDVAAADLGYAGDNNVDDGLDAEDKAKLLFQSCMEYETLQERGIQPLRDFLRSLGGWPALDDDWQADRFDWLNLTATLRQYNNDILLMLWVGADIKNSNENVIQFDQTSLGMPTRDYFLEPSNAKNLDAYVQFMRTTIEILGASADRAAAEAADIVHFETELAAITSAPEARRNLSLLYNKLPLGELSEQIPQIDWRQYLTVVQGRPINDTETVVMYAMDYMKHLVQLLAQTDNRTVANYLLWRFVRHRINNLDDRFQAAKQRFFYVLFGREESPERWKMCVSHVNTNMGMAVGAMFVRRYFDENSKRDTLDMTHELQQAFREILNTTEWLDAPTRHFAELKVNAMQLRIGYPDFILLRDQLNARFAGLRIERGRYFENTLRVLQHISHVGQEKLGEAINRTEWNTAPAIINAYYSRNKNQILFPAGILQPPFYHRHFPRALNYGGIGVVIGHELTHGFDDKGRLFDMDGNMMRWWSEASVEGFHKRARCLVRQYGNYTVPQIGVLVNGESTQGENIADNGGLKQAYRAYTQWLDGQPDAAAAEAAERMPGMQASARQLFFLNFAQVWCGATRPEAALNKLKTAVHSPGMYRVIGTLTNSEEFAQVYGCAAGTPMNPVEKCRVW